MYCFCIAEIGVTERNHWQRKSRNPEWECIKEPTLVSNGTSLRHYHRLYPSRHTNSRPFLCNCSPHQLQRVWPWNTSINTFLHHGPNVFDRIQIQWWGRPLKERNLFPLKPSHCLLCLVRGSVILHNQGVPLLRLEPWRIRGHENPSE